MKRYPIVMAVLLVFMMTVGLTTPYAGTFDDAAKKADHGAEVAGQKVDESTKAAREAVTGPSEYPETPVNNAITAVRTACFQ